MTEVELLRIDSARNLRRFYGLDVQPDLFGGVALAKTWGRTGRGGHVRRARHASRADTRAALERQQQAKERRGYHAAPGPRRRRRPAGFAGH